MAPVAMKREQTIAACSQRVSDADETENSMPRQRVLILLWAYMISMAAIHDLNACSQSWETSSLSMCTPFQFARPSKASTF
eukprot:1137217-Pelagomonas_calceolata.AAC.1